MSGVFISYASASKAKAQRLAEAVRALGYDVWRDDQLPPHRTYSEVIEERLRASKAVVVIWSKEAATSQWVKAEADLARSEAKLVQVRIDGAVPPLPFNQIQCADLSRWNGDASHPEWRKVAASLAELMGAPDRQSTAARPRLLPRIWTWVAVGLVALVLAAVGVWALRDRFPGATQASAARVAVLPLDVEGGDPAIQSFADGLLDEILGALSTSHVEALSRTDSTALRGAHADQAIKRLGIGLFLDGTVRKAGDLIKVRVSLNDARDHTTLWTKDFERPAAEAEALQADVSIRLANVAQSAILAREKGGAALDSATLAKFVEAGDNIGGENDKAETLLRQVIAKTPNFALAHARLAVAMNPTPSYPVPGREAAETLEAQRALQLDPKTGEAYLLLSILTTKGAWGDRQNLLTKGIAVDPDNAILHLFESRFLGQVGRSGDALASAQRVAALDSGDAGTSTTLCVALSHDDQVNQARAACERADKLWPRSTFNDFSQFYLDVGNGREQKALERLQKPDLIEFFGANLIAPWPPFLRARIARDVKGARAAALAAAKAADVRAFDRRHAYLMLAMTGQVDEALRQAELYYTPERKMKRGVDLNDTSLLFVKATEPVRRDPRFMALADQIGLVDFWRSSGKWPDYCAQPGLPYDCKAEAARLERPAALAPPGA